MNPVFPVHTADLSVLSVLVVLLSVEEPVGDLILGRVLHDGGELLHFLL